jgi:hypothetical protein
MHNVSHSRPCTHAYLLSLFLLFRSAFGWAPPTSTTDGGGRRAGVEARAVVTALSIRTAAHKGSEQNDEREPAPLGSTFSFCEQ